MTIRRVVRERIDPRLTAALFANYRTPVDAVLVSLALAEHRRRRPKKRGPAAEQKRQAGLWK